MGNVTISIFYFLAFGGYLVLGILAAAVTQVPRIGILTQGFSQILLVFLGMYFVSAAWRRGGFRAFRGITLPVLIFGTMCLATDALNTYQIAATGELYGVPFASTHSGWIYVLTHSRFCFMFMFILFAVAVPLSPRQNSLAASFFTLAMILVPLSAIISCYPWMIEGKCYRLPELHVHLVQLRSGGNRLNSILLILNGLSMCTLFWVWCNKKLGVSYYFYLLCYGAAVFCMYFSATRGVLLTVVVVHAAILMFSGMWRRKSCIVLLTVCAIIHVICALHFERGINKNFSMLGRYNAVFTKQFFEDLTKPKHNVIVVNSPEIVKDPKEAVKDPKEAVKDPKEAVKDPKEVVKDPKEAVKDPKEAVKDPKEIMENVEEVMPHNARIVATSRKDGQGRFSLYKTAWLTFRQNPVTGLQNRLLVTSHHSKRIWHCHPHNLIIEAFLTGGIIGGILFLYIIYRGIRDAVFVFGNLPDYGVFAIIFLYMLVSGMNTLGFVTSLGEWVIFAAVILRAAVLSVEPEKTTTITTQ